MADQYMCLYHEACIDGFTAAWAVMRGSLFYKIRQQMEFIAVEYSKPPPDVRGKHVIIVDFSYPIETLREMEKVAESIVILDHHKSAANDLSGLPIIPSGSYLNHHMRPKLCARFDMNKSGARLAWDYFVKSDVLNGYVPDIVRYAEDYDLWRFHYGVEEVKAYFTYLCTIERTFEEWDRIGTGPSSLTVKIIEDGKLLRQKHQGDVREACKLSLRRMMIGGYIIPVVNVPKLMASEAGDILSEGQPFSASYYDAPHGRVFSLRRREGNIDLSVIAKSYGVGGGGHAASAGFTMPHGWEGDKRKWMQNFLDRIKKKK